MEVPETRYALRQGHHIGYQVWGQGPLDVLEFNSGLMISIDETSDEPSWLRYEESLASFSRLIRFDALGLGLSDPPATGVGPTQGVRCTMAMVETAGNFGIEIRAGLHVGEIELRGDDIGGLAVHIAAGVSALAEPGEIRATGTVRDLVVGSGIAFDDRGRQALKGVPGEWQLLAVQPD